MGAQRDQTPDQDLGIEGIDISQVSLLHSNHCFPLPLPANHSMAGKAGYLVILTLLQALANEVGLWFEVIYRHSVFPGRVAALPRETRSIQMFMIFLPEQK